MPSRFMTIQVTLSGEAAPDVWDTFRLRHLFGIPDDMHLVLDEVRVFDLSDDGTIHRYWIAPDRPNPDLTLAGGVETHHWNEGVPLYFGDGANGGTGMQSYRFWNGLDVFSTITVAGTDSGGSPMIIFEYHFEDGPMIPYPWVTDEVLTGIVVLGHDQTAGGIQYVIPTFSVLGGQSEDTSD